MQESKTQGGSDLDVKTTKKQIKVTAVILPTLD